MVPLLPLRDGVRALPISSFRQSMPSFYMNAPDCICSPGRLPLGAFCAGRDARARRPGATAPISIHAPRAGCDALPVVVAPVSQPISIHAPRAGCDQLPSGLPTKAVEFQSTHPVRGATRIGIPAPVLALISIHAPRAGCDSGEWITPRGNINKFQSTHPVRGATKAV